MAANVGELRPARGSPEAVDTRTQILSVARELLVAQGFAATTTRELAERLGFTKAALYYHFRTKDDLLAALAAPLVERMRALVTRTPLRPAAAARRAVLAAYVDIAAADLDLVRVLTQDPSVTRRPVTAEHAALYERMLQLLSGHDQPDTAERAHARAALGAIRAALIHADPAEDADVLRRAALDAASGALRLPHSGHGPRH
jgi:AcrR family transcriptional regulator